MCRSQASSDQATRSRSPSARRTRRWPPSSRRSRRFSGSRWIDVASTAGFLAMLERLFPGRVQRHAPLAPLTTFRVGGRADALLETRSADEITIVLALAHQMDVAVTMLGGGSNVLASDAGVRGLVLRP